MLDNKAIHGLHVSSHTFTYTQKRLHTCTHVDAQILRTSHLYTRCIQVNLDSGRWDLIGFIRRTFSVFGSNTTTYIANMTDDQPHGQWDHRDQFMQYHFSPNFRRTPQNGSQTLQAKIQFQN